jgi:4a-hydroxytetrahydrobiopterin dehydratase
MAVLPKYEIKTRLKYMSGWKLDGGELRRRFRFADFAASMEFVNKVAELAESADHHPDIVIKFNKVRLMLVTHSEGGVTEQDFSLAAKIDALAPPLADDEEEAGDAAESPTTDGADS